MGLFSSIGGALGGIFGGGSDAAEEQARRLLARQRRGLAIADRAAGQLDIDTQRARNLFEQRREESLALFDAAQALLQGAGDTARDRTLEREDAALRSNAASLASRGLFNTTALDSIQAGTRQRTDETLANIDDAEAGALASLATSRAGFTADLLGQEAQFLQGSGVDLFRAESQVADRILGQPVVPTPSEIRSQNQSSLFSGVLGGLGGVLDLGLGLGIGNLFSGAGFFGGGGSGGSFVGPGLEGQLASQFF